MHRRRWLAAAILSAIYASLLCAGPALPDIARKWIVGGLFFPHMLLTWFVDLLAYALPRNWPVMPELWAGSFAVTLPASYLYVLVAVGVRRFWRWSRE